MIIDIDEASYILQNDGIAAIPTETVYGLAGNINSEEALKKIFSTKGRPFFDPLIVHVSSYDQAKSLSSNWSRAAEVLSKNFWPGPLTLVLNKNQGVSNLISAGMETVGIRMPRSSLTLRLITLVGAPLAAPSANMFGKTSPTSAEHVEEEFQGRVPVLDGGNCQVGIESTIVDLSTEGEASILRLGEISKSEIEQCLRINNVKLHFSVTKKQQAPGSLKHHYMPKVPLIILDKQPQDTDKLKVQIIEGLKSTPDVIEEVKIIKPQKIEKVQFLHLESDPKIAARTFYSRLREISNMNPDIIVFVKTHEMLAEPWFALNDRIFKAATLTINVDF